MPLATLQALQARITASGPKPMLCAPCTSLATRWSAVVGASPPCPAGVLKGQPAPVPHSVMCTSMCGSFLFIRDGAGIRKVHLGTLVGGLEVYGGAVVRDATTTAHAMSKAQPLRTSSVYPPPFPPAHTFIRQHHLIL